MTSEARALRKRAVTTAAGAAALGAAPMLAMTHGHRGFAFLLMGLQVVLIVAAMRFMVEMKRAKARE